MATNQTFSGQISVHFGSVSLFKSDFSSFWLTEPKCTESDLTKITEQKYSESDLKKIPRFVPFGGNLTHFGPNSRIRGLGLFVLISFSVTMYLSSSDDKSAWSVARMSEYLQCNLTNLRAINIPEFRKHPDTGNVTNCLDNKVSVRSRLASICQTIRYI